MKRSLVILPLLAGASTLATAAYAQTAPALSQASVQSSAEPQDQGGEIVVTARKRAESLLDVPVSITAFNNDRLVQANVKSVVDLQNVVPNLQYTQRGDLDNQISIRGVGGDPRNIGIESGVGLYVDQVFAGRSGAYNIDLANISQIEILRGPQGTIFGKNTTGGVINITTDKPTDLLKGSIDGSYGNYNALRVRASISGPITDNFYVGLTLATTNRDGYIHNIYNNTRINDINRRGGRVQAVWKPSDRLDFYWTADRTVNRTQTPLGQPAAPFTGIAAPYAGVNSQFVIDNDQSNRVDLASTGVSQTINLDLGGPTVTSVSAYRKTDVLVYSDGDALPVDVLHSGPFTDNSHFFSQELRLSSPSTGRLRYVGGLYYFNQHATSHRDIFFNGSLPNGYVTDALVNTEAAAAFANADFDITRGLTFTGGVRYTHEKKTGFYHQTSPGKNYSFDGLSRTDEDVSWTTSLNYKIDRQVSVYATVSRGFKSGGFNVDPITVTGVTAAGINFAPENLMNYEVGAKADLFDRKLTLSAAAFYDKFNNKQVSQFLSGASVPTVVISNAATARIEGFEFESTLRPSKFWTIDASVSHLATKYTSFPNAAVVNGAFVAYTGNRIENAPDWSANLGVERKQPIAPGYLTARINGRYTGNTYFQPDNLPINLQSHYTLIDARVGFETRSGNLSIAFWGKNLTDKTYYVFSRVSLGTHQVLYGEPRTYGIEVIKKF